jgi:hypothetical protein
MIDNASQSETITRDRETGVTAVEILGVNAAGDVERIRTSGGSLVASSSNNYATNAIDDYSVASKTFICKESSSGEWIFTLIDETSTYPVFTYATIVNNPTMTTYSLAFASRTTLTYNLYSVAT